MMKLSLATRRLFYGLLLSLVALNVKNINVLASHLTNDRTTPQGNNIQQKIIALSSLAHGKAGYQHRHALAILVATHHNDVTKEPLPDATANPLPKQTSPQPAIGAPNLGVVLSSAAPDISPPSPQQNPPPNNADPSPAPAIEANQNPDTPPKKLFSEQMDIVRAIVERVRKASNESSNPSLPKRESTISKTSEELGKDLLNVTDSLNKLAEALNDPHVTGRAAIISTERLAFDEKITALKGHFDMAISAINCKGEKESFDGAISKLVGEVNTKTTEASGSVPEISTAKVLDNTWDAMGTVEWKLEHILKAECKTLGMMRSKRILRDLEDALNFIRGLKDQDQVSKNVLQVLVNMKTTLENGYAKSVKDASPRIEDQDLQKKEAELTAALEGLAKQELKAVVKDELDFGARALSDAKLDDGVQFLAAIESTIRLLKQYAETFSDQQRQEQVRHIVQKLQDGLGVCGIKARRVKWLRRIVRKLKGQINAAASSSVLDQDPPRFFSSERTWFDLGAVISKLNEAISKHKDPSLLISTRNELHNLKSDFEVLALPAIEMRPSGSPSLAELHKQLNLAVSTLEKTLKQHSYCQPDTTVIKLEDIYTRIKALITSLKKETATRDITKETIDGLSKIVCNRLGVESEVDSISLSGQSKNKDRR